ncbi:hypothetical protein ACLF6K_37545 [Streptomyces xanthophaeus]|uniref:hypothetical protein n=1 Tax=Streptomyces xanthophaeus TaxID=67385 RepID=UPI00398FA77B
MAAPRTWVVGEVVTAALMNQEIRDQCSLLLNPPIASLTQSVTQSTTNGGWTTITFTNEEIDSYNGHSTVTNTSRYVCQLAGWYRIVGRVAFASNSTGSRGSRILKNGNVVNGSASMAGAGTLGPIAVTSRMVQLAASDYVEVQGGQDSGGSLSTNSSGEAMSTMDIEWIHA